MTPVRLTALTRTGTVAAIPSPQDSPAHAHRRHALDSLHHHGRARAGRTQRDATAVDGPARHLGRYQYPLPVRLSFLGSVLRRGDGGDRRPSAVANGGILAVAAARSAQPDRRYRADAAGDERPLVRGDHRLSEDRGDPDRD